MMFTLNVTFYLFWKYNLRDLVSFCVGDYLQLDEIKETFKNINYNIHEQIQDTFHLIYSTTTWNLGLCLTIRNECRTILIVTVAISKISYRKIAVTFMYIWILSHFAQVKSNKREIVVLCIFEISNIRRNIFLYEKQRFVFKTTLRTFRIVDVIKSYNQDAGIPECAVTVSHSYV